MTEPLDVRTPEYDYDKPARTLPQLDGTVTLLCWVVFLQALCIFAIGALLLWG